MGSNDPDSYREELRIEFVSSTDEQMTITIFDLTGRQLESHNVSEHNFQCGENLPAGIYLAEIVGGEKRKMIRLVKE